MVLHIMFLENSHIKIKALKPCKSVIFFLNHKGKYSHYKMRLLELL